MLSNDIRAGFDGCDGVVLAISGGIDSMVLLESFCGVSPCPAVVCHVDHGLRKDSGSDATFVEAVAKKYGLTVECISLAIRPNVSVQQHARSQRRAALRGIAQKYGYKSIATAHHHDDWVEQFYISTTRGGGIEPLQQLTRHEHDGMVWLRPLTYRSRPELRAYAVAKKVSWREDPTNLKTDYTRNKVRAILQAVVAAQGDGTLAARLRLQDAASIVQSRTTKLLERARRTAQLPMSIALDVVVLREFSSAQCREVLRAAFSEMGASISQEAIGAVEQALHEGRSKRMTPRGVVVFFERETVHIVRNFGRGLTWWDRLTETPSASLRPPTIWFGGSFEACENVSAESAFHFCSTSDDLKIVGWHAGLELPRTVRKQIKEVPFYKRWHLPVVCDGETPVWVPGIWSQSNRTGVGFKWNQSSGESLPKTGQQT